MLKWAVTKRTDMGEGIPFASQMNDLSSSSSLMNCGGDSNSAGNIGKCFRFNDDQLTISHLPSLKKEGLKRQSLEAKRKAIFDELDKENNNCVISPSISVLGSPFALRDVGNLTPTSTPISTKRRKRSFYQIQTPQFAPTLPTFDIEYSPFEGQIFNNPRYLDNFAKNDKEEIIDQPNFKKYKPSNYNKINTEPCLTPLQTFKPSLTPKTAKHRLSQKRLSYRKSKIIHQSVSKLIPKPNLNDSIPSSDMNDSTLDQVIDAILESSRKKSTPKKMSYNFKVDKSKLLEIKTPFNWTKDLESEESPTYQAAEDPANDLKEEFLNKSLENSIFNEREIKTPEVCKLSNNFKCFSERKSVKKLLKTDLSFSSTPLMEVKSILDNTQNNCSKSIKCNNMLIKQPLKVEDTKRCLRFSPEIIRKAKVLDPVSNREIVFKSLYFDR